MLPEVNLHEPRVQKTILVGLFFVGVNWLFFFTDYMPFFYQPKRQEIEEKRVKYEHLALRVEEAKRASENLPRLEEELAQLHEKWEVAMSHLPERKEIASLLRRVTLAGERSGVRFLLFEPEEVFGQGVYDEHPVSVKVLGPYHGIGSFLGRLMNLGRIVRVSDLALESFRTEEEEQLVVGDMVVSAFTVPLETTGEGGAQPGHPERASRRDGHSAADEDDSDE